MPPAGQHEMVAGTHTIIHLHQTEDGEFQFARVDLHNQTIVETFCEYYGPHPLSQARYLFFIAVSTARYTRHMLIALFEDYSLGFGCPAPSMATSIFVRDPSEAGGS
jgi:hypothetical protein